MSKKAEEAALKAYPVDYGPAIQYPECNNQFDFNECFREKFQEGYKQALKDLMKGAMGGTVMASKCGDKYQQLLITDWNSSDDLHNGDKVRIIIVKEN